MTIFSRVGLSVLLFLMLFVFSGSGQDTAWKTISISKDLSIRMPGTALIRDTLQVKTVSSFVNGHLFEVRYMTTPYVVTDGDRLIIAYDDFLKDI
jgi:hypothetical protein